MAMKAVRYGEYQQISPERDVTADGFPRGKINFIMQSSSTKCWNPYRSYIRMRLRLSKADGDPLELSDGIGPSMFQGDTLWQQMNISCNGTRISGIDDYVPQVSALRQRYAISETRRKFIDTLNFAQANVHERINEVSEDGIDYSHPVEEQLHPGDQASTIEYAFPINSTDYVDMGFLPNITVQITQANNGRAIFGAFGLGENDIRQHLRIGDICEYIDTNGANHLDTFIIHSFVDAATAQISTMNSARVVNSAATAIDNIAPLAPLGVIRQANIYENGGVMTGVNTLWTEELIPGDFILNQETGEKYEVTRVANNTTCLVYPPPRQEIFPTQNWLRIRRSHSRQVTEYEICFKPCMGLFSVDEYLGGKWKLELIPHSNGKYQKRAIESIIDKDIGVDFDFEVLDMQMYAWIGTRTSGMNGMKKYGFSEIRCQGQTVTHHSLQNKAFVINKNSHMFTMAFQKPDSGEDSSFSVSKFRMLNDYEKRISRYQLRTNSHTIPTPLPQIDTNPAQNRDFATQQYYETMHYNRAYTHDSPENLSDWFSRGPYYSYAIPNRNDGNSSMLFVSTEFNDVVPENFSLLVFDHFYKTFELEYESGLVKNVREITKEN